MLDTQHGSAGGVDIQIHDVPASIGEVDTEVDAAHDTDTHCCQ